MAGKSKRRVGDLVACSQCGTEKSWQVGVFKSEGGKPRQPCVSCDTLARTSRANHDLEHTRAAVRARMARWRTNNPDKVAQANHAPRSFDRELAKQRINRWRRDHPQVRAVEVHNRKALKQRLPHTLTTADWQRCLTYWGSCCCICGRASGNGYVIAQEHWIALSDPRTGNPGTVPWNILPMCHARAGATGGCNNAKWRKDPIDWLTAYLGSDKAPRKLGEIQAYFNAVTPPVMAMLLERCIATLGGTR